MITELTDEQAELYKLGEGDGDYEAEQMNKEMIKETQKQIMQLEDENKEHKKILENPNQAAQHESIRKIITQNEKQIEKMKKIIEKESGDYEGDPIDIAYVFTAPKDVETDHPFKAPRLLYYSELIPIKDCMFSVLQDKMCEPKSYASYANAVFIQTAIWQLRNDALKKINDYSVLVKDKITIDIVKGDILQMDDCVVGQLKKTKPDADLAQFLPNFDKDLEKYYQETVYKIHKDGKKDIYTIEDGGVIPC